MNKKIKFFIVTLIIIISIIVLDTLQALAFDNSPLLKLRKIYDGGEINYVDKGLLIDTYHCFNNEKGTVLKGFSYSCSAISNYTIIDTSKDLKDFSCAMALEEIYENNDAIYYLTCVKSDYIVVRYANGNKEGIISALGHGRIQIKDLDKFNIEYIKYKK